MTDIDETQLDDLVSIGDAIGAGRAISMKHSQGRTTATLTLFVHGHSLQVYLKEDNLEEMGVRKLLKDNLQPSHLWRSWQRTLQLGAAGIPVQQPVAMLKFRRWGLVRKTVYVGEYLPDMAPLSTILSERKRADGLTADAELLATLAKELRSMHNRGFYHRDLKADNILAERQTGRWMITFIDLEGAVAKRHLTASERVVDLGRLWASLLTLTTPAEREQFLDCYASVGPQLDRALLRRLIERRVRFLQARRFGNLPAVGARLMVGMGEGVASVRPRRWLIIVLGSSQEAAQMAPLLAALHQGFPTVRLEILVSAGAAPALAQNPDLHAVLTVSGKLVEHSADHDGSMSMLQAIRSLRARHYEVVIDLTNNVVSAVLTRATGASVRIGYRTASVVSKWTKRATCYTQMITARREQRSPVHHYLLVAEALGLDGATFEPHGAVVPEDRLKPAHAVLRSHS